MTLTADPLTAYDAMTYCHNHGRPGDARFLALSLDEWVRAGGPGVREFVHNGRRLAVVAEVLRATGENQ